MSAHLEFKKLCVLLSLTIISILLFQFKFVQAQSNIPQVIHSCITYNDSKKTYCSRWQWNGSYYEIIKQDGRISSDIIEVERFDKDLVVIYLIPSHFSSQIDPVKRREERYEGYPDGNRIKNGVVQNRSDILENTIVLAALAQTNQRGIIATGWGGIDNENLPDTIFKIDAVPDDWLFPKCAAVMHHGGAGTTAAGLKVGAPSIIVPFFSDQPFWGYRVFDLGVGFKKNMSSLHPFFQAIAKASSEPELRYLFFTTTSTRRFFCLPIGLSEPSDLVLPAIG